MGVLTDELPSQLRGAEPRILSCGSYRAVASTGNRTPVAAACAAVVEARVRPLYGVDRVDVVVDVHLVSTRGVIAIVGVTRAQGVVVKSSRRTVVGCQVAR